MSKKRSNLKLVTESKPNKKRQLVNSPSRSSGQQPADPESGRSAIAESFGKQAFSSEKQALGFLISQVVSRYEGDPREQDEMRKFLESIVETDPVLRSEILSGTTIIS